MSRHLQTGQMRLWLLTLLLLLTAAVALWRYAPAPTLTLTPEWRVERAPVSARPQAYLSIPQLIPVEQVKESVRQAISGQLFAQQIKVPGKNIQIIVKGNGPLVLRIKDAKLRMELPIEFETEGDLEVDGELTIATNARFDIDPNWEPNLHVKTTFWWDDEPSVGFWPFLFDIGDKLQPFIQTALNAQSEKLMEQARSAYKLRDMAQVGWRQLQQPLALGHGGQRWLLLQPQAAWVEPVTSDADYIYVNFWIGLYPQVVEGSKPQLGPNAPLPDLTKGEPPAKRLVLDYPVTISYAQAAQAIAQNLRGRRVSLADGWLEITGLRLYPAGSEVALQLEFSGQRKTQWLPGRGSVTLLGKLLYDPVARRLSLTDVHFAPAAARWWTWRQRWVLQSSLPQKVAAALTWPMAARIDAATRQMGVELAGVRGRNFDLFGGINTTVPTHAQLTAAGMSLQLRAVGDMSLMIRP